jgi:hypothetical protein
MSKFDGLASDIQNLAASVTHGRVCMLFIYMVVSTSNLDMP